MKRFWLSCLLLLLSAPAAAVEVVACSLPLPPHTYENAAGEPDGFATRVLQRLAQQLDWQLHIRYMPWLRVVAEAKSGQCDLVFTVLKQPHYETFMNFPQQPLQERANVLVVRRERGIQYDGHLETFMRQYSLGLYRDKAVDERFEQIRRAPWARIDQATTARENLRKLLAGRFDAALENQATAIHEARALGALDAIEILQPPLNITHAYVAFPKAGRLSRDMAKFDGAMAQFRRSAEFRALETQYLQAR